MLWTRVLDQLGRIEGRLIHGDIRFGGMSASLARLEQRLDTLETAWRRERLSRRLPCWAAATRRLLATLAAIATPREWTLGVLVVALSLKGIVAPEQLQPLVLRLVGIR